MSPLAKRMPQRARKTFGPGDGKTPRVAGKAFALVAALAAALARLCFDIEESQSASEMPAINITGAVCP
jgi:hypothetical protein